MVTQEGYRQLLLLIGRQPRVRREICDGQSEAFPVLDGGQNTHHFGVLVVSFVDE